jgi:hypothetical protein
MTVVAVIYLVLVVIHLLYAGLNQRAGGFEITVALSCLVALGLGVVLAVGNLL